MLGPMAFLAALLVAVAPSPFPAGHVTALCGALTIPYQQQALVSAGGGLWVACRDAGEVARVDRTTDLTTRRTTLRGFRPWALAAGSGALWPSIATAPPRPRVQPSTRRSRAGSSG